MKYLKIYEGLNQQGFYHIPYSKNQIDIIKLAIKKLKITDKLKKKILQECNEINPFGGKFDSLLICINSKDKNNPWSFWEVDNLYGSEKDLHDGIECYTEEGYKFLGKIIVKDWEIQADKYNL